MPKFLINAVGARLGGSMRHLAGFAESLGALNPDQQHLIYLSQNVELNLNHKNVQILRPAYSTDSFYKRLCFDQFQIPTIVRDQKIDVLISLLNFGTIKVSIPQVIFARNAIYYSEYYFQTASFSEAAISTLKKWLIYASLRSADAIVAPTNAMRDLISKSHPDLPQDRIKVVYHGFDSREFVDSTAALPEFAAQMLSARGRGKSKLLFVGHPVAYKGADVLFKALEELKRTDPDVVLSMPVDTRGGVNSARNVNGYDEFAAMYRELVRQGGIEENVLFLGWIPQKSMHSLYKGSDIFIFPSLCESFGFPMLEAMSSGLPVVAADTPANREILGEAALFYPPLAPSALSACVRKIIQNPGLRQSLVKKAGERIAGYDWGWDRYIKEISAICDSVKNSSAGLSDWRSRKVD